MRALFGVVALLIVLALVGVMSVRQIRAARHPVPAVADGLGAIPGLAASANESDRARQIQGQVTDDLAKAMSQGAARQQDAEKP